jgi:hypothetical protein
MRAAATAASKPVRHRPLIGQQKASAFLQQRDWKNVYEGLPNATVLTTEMNHGTTNVIIRLQNGEIIKRPVGEVSYVTGRRGNLNYLSEKLYYELMRNAQQASPKGGRSLISGRTFRSIAEHDLEIAPDVFIIGSLAGDSLVRHAFGTCVSVAAKLLARQLYFEKRFSERKITARVNHTTSHAVNDDESAYDKPKTHETSLRSPQNPTKAQIPEHRASRTVDHQDLHLNRRRLKHAIDIDLGVSRADSWIRSRWLEGLCRSS